MTVGVEPVTMEGTYSGRGGGCYVGWSIVRLGVHGHPCTRDNQEAN
ncbi:MAG: hypothetical protein JF632_01655 [Acidobacteria bacterium]|nr:hypothetical protein [Acidobacteriota bacterium]